MSQDGLPFCVGALEFVFQFWKLALFDCILVSIATTVVEVGATLTVRHIWTLAFTSNKSYIQLVGAFLQHFDDHELTSPASRSDRHNVAIHAVVSTSLQGSNRQGGRARAVDLFLFCPPRHKLRKLLSTALLEGEAQLAMGWWRVSAVLGTALTVCCSRLRMVPVRQC